MSDMNDFIIKDGVLTKYNGEESDVVVPDGVTAIGKMAFSNCRSLESIVIPKSVTSIEVIAFFHCRGLTSITIPDSVTHIGGDAFSDTPWIEKQRTINPFVIINGILIDGRMHKGDVVVPDGVTSIGSNAFYKCSDLTSITIPDSVTSIGDASFCGCSGLASITIPNSVTSIGSNAFEYCLGLTSITIPNGVTSIGKSTFWACRNLASITIPDSVTSIGRVAFENCSTLTSITIPQNVLRIGDNAFKECESLTEIRILSNALETGSIEGAFDSCKNLKRVYAPLSAMTKWNSYCKSSFVFIELDGDNRNIFVYSEKSDSNNISSLICKDKYGLYDSELINNGHLYKYTLPQRLAGAVGRLKNPVKLTDENRALYIDMLNKNAKKLIPFAEEYGMPELIRYLLELNVLSEKALETVKKEIESSTVPDIAALANMEVKAAAPTDVKVVKRPKAPKLSNLKVVELLEEKVLNNDIEGVKGVFTDYSPIEFTARALGLACRYCGAEMVKTLIECGASFEFESTPDLKKKYNCSIKLSNNTQEDVCYELYLLEDAYKDKNKKKIIDVSERVKVLEILKQKDEGNLALVLYYAILQSEPEIYQTLIELGEDKLPWFYESVVADTYKTYHERGEFDWYLEKKNNKNLPDMLERLLRCMEGNKIAIYPRNLYGDRYGDGKFRKKFCSVKTFEIMVEHTDMVAKAKTWDLINAIIEENNVTAIKFALENKWISTQEDIDKLEKAVSKRKKCSAEFVGCILEMKRQLDQGSDKSLTDELSLDGKDQTPTAILKKIWGTKKLEDGTLMIISYKGEETDIVIPSVIGKNTVTAISPETFNPSAPRISDELSEVRRSIVSVTIPGTIRKIPEKMFAYREKNSHSYDLAECKNIKKIILEDGITEICDKAFYGCTGIKSIVIPDSVQIIGESAFERCTKLEKITLPKHIHKLPDRIFFHTGFVDYDIGDQITSLGESVFAHCSKLQSVKLNMNITDIPVKLFEGCTALQTVELPDSLKTIGDFAFYGCISLKPFAIPRSVNQVGKYAFMSCDQMADEKGRIIIDGELVGFSTKGAWDSGWTLPPYHDYIEPWKIDDDIKKVSIPPRSFAPLVYREYSGTVECVNLTSVNIGDEVEFGRFPSNNNFEMQPLKWIAVARENDMTLLLSKDCLFMLESDLATYSYKKWSNSSIRKMLNNGFMDMAFVSEERDHICKVSNSTTYFVRKGKVDTEQTKDKVFLLSKEEVEKYLQEEKDRTSQFAPRAVMFGDDTSCKYDRDYWVTRTPTGYGVEGVSISKGFFTNRGSGYCRPAMWVK